MVHDSLAIIQPEGLGRAVRDALTKITGSARGPGDLSAPAHLALLAAGRFETARLLLRSDMPSPALPLIAARYAAWSGDLRTVAAAWAAVRHSAQALGAADPGDQAAEHGLRRMTWTELQRTATDVGDPAFAAVLHRLAARASAVEGGSGSGGMPAMLTALPGQDDLDEPAKLILDTVHGLLGAEPDAMRHRLRLRPVLNGADPVIDVRDIRFGDGTASLRGALESTGPSAVRMEWRVAQTSGAIPLTVLLEPRISGRLLSARVDDGDANLDSQPFGTGMIVPVQLVLDEERRLRLDVDAAATPRPDLSRLR